MVQIREDFRRDGLAANFMANGELIKLVSQTFPSSKINIGYPIICKSEYEMCEEILKKNTNINSELAIVGHCSDDNIKIIRSLIKNAGNASANIWIPTSNDFIKNTIKSNPEKILSKAKNIGKYWSLKCDKPLDIALADITYDEQMLEDRVVNWTSDLLDSGFRNIILCDTRGIGTIKKLEKIFESGMSDIDTKRLEYHPHNDNLKALENIEYMISKKVLTIGTAIYGSGERKSMLDPRELLNFELEFKKKYFQKFEILYKQLIGNHENVLSNVFGKNKVITGTQYRLNGRYKDAELLFGVTSDTYTVSKIFGKKINSEELKLMKDRLLYKNKKLFLKKEELIKSWPMKVLE